MGDTEAGSWGSRELGAHIQSEQSKSEFEAKTLVLKYSENVARLYAIPMTELTQAVHTLSLERYGNG